MQRVELETWEGITEVVKLPVDVEVREVNHDQKKTTVYRPIGNSKCIHIVSMPYERKKAE